jgi:hypothetical protein
MKTALSLLLLVCSLRVAAQNPGAQLVADQTFKMDGDHAFTYALAQGDQIVLRVEELSRRKIKAVEFVQVPGNLIFRAYELDSVLVRNLVIPQTGIYELRVSESGMGKKVCRFTLHRTPGSADLARFDTRVPWDVAQYPQFQVRHRSVEASRRIEVVSLGGQSTVAASKFGLKSPVSTYQFTLPPNTVRWAYRLAVGQASVEAQRRDASTLTDLLRKGAIKMANYQPQTALAAFALGVAIDMTVSTSGENVEYALVDGANLNQFLKGQNYQAFMQQSSIAVDVQRRYTPVAGTYYFALRSDNWVQDINVTIDIEAVTETPVYETETFLEPVK